MAAYSEAIAQGGALGGAAMVDRSGQTADQAGLLRVLHRANGALGAETLVEPQGETSGGHGLARWWSEWRESRSC